jgi:hypothetical protein
MSDQIITSIIGILTAIIGVAIIAVLVGQKSETSNVITSGGKAFSSILTTALSPVANGASIPNSIF